MWIEHLVYDNIVHPPWHQTQSRSPLKLTLDHPKTTNKTLKLWNIKAFGNIKKQIQKITANIAQIQSLPTNAQNFTREINLQI